MSARHSAPVILRLWPSMCTFSPRRWMQLRGRERWRNEGLHRRCFVRPTLDLDQRGRRAWSLAELRGALVAREHIGVAVAAQRLLAVVFGIVPGAAGQLH